MVAVRAVEDVRDALRYAREHGRFFLPYQLHYSAEQLRRAYPEVDEFFAAKLAYDPERVFSNLREVRARPLSRPGGAPML